MIDKTKQTAMQIHIQWLKEQLQQAIYDGLSESWINAYKICIDNAESMIERERQQHLITWCDSRDADTTGRWSSFKQWYNETYLNHQASYGESDRWHEQTTEVTNDKETK